MTTGNVLYLAMAIGTFVLLSAVLAYQSWQQSLGAPDAMSASGNEPHRADNRLTSEARKVVGRGGSPSTPGRFPSRSAGR